MKIGITQLCVKGSIDEVILKTSTWGYDVLELGLRSEDGVLHMKMSEQERSDVAKRVRETGLELVSLVASPVRDAGSMISNDASSRRAAEEMCRRVLDVAASMDADTILLVPGALTPEVQYDVAVEYLIESLRKIAPHAESRGVTVAVEQVWNKFLVSPLDMKRVMEEVAHPRIGVYIDTGNMLFWGYPEHWIRILAPFIAKIHFKDFKRDGMQLQFVPLGEGEVNWDNVMREIVAAGYTGPVISEVGGEDDLHARMVPVMREIVGRK